VRLLLDTSVLLWWFFDEPIAASARSAINSPEAEIRVSPVSVWEAEIKRARGKLSPPEDIAAAVRDEGFVELPIRLEHGAAAGRLPRHHADPFDRMLVAQAQLEGLSIVTADDQIRRYDVHTVPAR
jgi:PIN domain nuclease of toxin-antitoxin system